MILRTCRRLFATQGFITSPAMVGRRHFTVKAIYSSFPASLTCYRPKSRFGLFDYKERDSRPNDLYIEAVSVADDGFVYPGSNAPNYDITNGAVMYPVSTFVMQEEVRHFYDHFLDLQEAGEEVEVPHIYTIPKNTPIPGRLILTNDFMAQFTLQPSRGMFLLDLNRLLDEFFDKHATKQTAEDWIDGHPFESSTPDDADDVWMNR